MMDPLTGTFIAIRGLTELVVALTNDAEAYERGDLTAEELVSQRETLMESWADTTKELKDAIKEAGG